MTADDGQVRPMTEGAQEQAERLALQARRKMLAKDLEGAIADQGEARPADYRSVLSVLEPLRRVCLGSHPELADELGTTIGLLKE